jgi:hypothetical protein
MMADHDPSQPVVFIPPTDFNVERIFPIRSLVGGSFSLAETEKEVPATRLPDKIQSTVVDLDIAIGDGTETTTLKGEPEKENQSDASTYLPPPYPHIPPQNSLRKLTSKLSESSLFGRRTTERTQFVPSHTGAPGVLPGITSSNTPRTFQRCEDEPIHTPGAIQQHGVLVALRWSETEQLDVRIASENSKQLLGIEPDELFQLESFLYVFTEDSREDLAIRVGNALRVAAEDVLEPAADTYLEVFELNAILPDGKLKQLWCAVHISKGTKDLVICEFENHSDAFYAEGVHAGNDLSDFPNKMLTNVVPHPLDTVKSTTSNSQPLRALEMTRRKPQAGHSSMDVFNVMTQAQQQLAVTRTVQQALEVVVGLISEVTGFHRVMFYRFDAQKNGCVDAELVNPLASADVYRGEFPIMSSGT